MNLLKRPVRMLILFFVILIFGSAIASAIFVRIPIQEIDANLRQMMQPMLTIDWDAEESEAYFQYLITYHDAVFHCYGFDGHEPSDDCEVTTVVVQEDLTVEDVHQMGALDQVYFYDYLIHRFVGMQSIDLSPVASRYNTEIGFDEGWIPRFPLVGTTRTELVQIEQEEIYLIQGRQFEIHEQNPSSEPIAAIVSNEFVIANDLSLSSHFTLSQWIMIPSEPYYFIWPRMINELENNEIYAHIETEFEIIGIFDLTDLDEDAGVSVGEFWHRDNLLQTIFIPSWFLIEDQQRSNQMILSMLENVDTEIGLYHTARIEADMDMFPIDVSPIFVLNDYSSIDDFKSAATSYLPRFHRFSNLAIPVDEVVYSDMRNSIDTLQNVSNWISYVSIGATFLILSVLLTLFLRHHRNEMVAQLTKGKRKGQLISQILIETLVISNVALILSFFIGQMISDTISSNVLVSDNDLMIEEESDPWWSPMMDLSVYRERTLRALGMSTHDVAEQSLNIQTIALFSLIGIGTVISSTVVPVMYVGKLTREEGDIGSSRNLK